MRWSDSEYSHMIVENNKVPRQKQLLHHREGAQMPRIRAQHKPFKVAACAESPHFHDSTVLFQASVVTIIAPGSIRTISKSSRRHMRPHSESCRFWPGRLLAISCRQPRANGRSTSELITGRSRSFPIHRAGSAVLVYEIPSSTPLTTARGGSMCKAGQRTV